MNKQTYISLCIKNIAVVTGALLGGMNFTLLFDHSTSMIGGLWSVISAILVLEATSPETYISAKNRLLGTFFGALVSGGYLFFFSFTIFSFVVAIGVGVLVCFLFGHPQNIKLCGITISVVVLSSTIGHDLHPFTNAGLRFAESAIGTAVAIIVVLIALPIENVFHLKKEGTNFSQ